MSTPSLLEKIFFGFVSGVTIASASGAAANHSSILISTCSTVVSCVLLSAIIVGLN
jgi:hypothetical protein